MRLPSTAKATITLVAMGVSATALGATAVGSPKGGARSSEADGLAAGMGVGVLVGSIAAVVFVLAARRSRDPWVCRSLSSGAWAASTTSFVLVLGLGWGGPATFRALAVLAGIWIVGCCAAIAAAWVGAVVAPELWAGRSDLLPETSSALLRAWPSETTGDRDGGRHPGVPSGPA
jgi:hypothetical protein